METPESPAAPEEVSVATLRALRTAVHRCRTEFSERFSLAANDFIAELDSEIARREGK